MNQYEVGIEKVVKGNETGKEAVNFQFETRDDLAELIEKVTDKMIFQSEEDALQLTVGLKLIGEVFLKNRDLPFVQEVMPAFQSIMKEVKAK